MKFKTHKDGICVGGCLQGYIVAEYKVLKKIFGMPHEGDGYKVDAEWDIEFEDGTSARIYNYKTGKNYKGSKGTPKTRITKWHIGGDDDKAIPYIEGLIREATK